MFSNSSFLGRLARPVAIVSTLILLCAGSTAADTSAYRTTGASVPDAVQVPLITYQGRLLNPATGEPKPDGSYPARLSIYAAETGGTATWSEAQVIVTSKGLFSVTLGSQPGNAIPVGFSNQQGLYLYPAEYGKPESSGVNYQQ